MIRFACPSCKSITSQPASAAGHVFACPDCGQKLLVPGQPTSKSGDDAPPLPAALPSSFTSEPSSAPKRSPAAPPEVPLPRRRYDDDFDDDLADVPRRRRGYYSAEEAVKAASMGLICALIALGLQLGAAVLWFADLQSLRARFGGGPNGSVVLATLLVAVVSVALAIVSLVYSSRGHDPSNTEKRGQATAGLVCGIVALVLGCIAALFFSCVGMVVLSLHG